MGLATIAINVAHAWRHSPKISEQDKMAFTAKERDQLQGSSQGGGKDQGGKWVGNGGKAGDCGKGLGNQWGKVWQFSGNRSYGKGFGKKGLNDMGGNGWDSDDVWDLNGNHLQTAGPALECDGENLEPCDSKMHNLFPLMRESVRVLG